MRLLDVPVGERRHHRPTTRAGPSASPRRVPRHGELPSRGDPIDEPDTCVINHNAGAESYRRAYDGTSLKAA